MADNLTGRTYAAITALNEDERMVTRHKRPADPERLFNTARNLLGIRRYSMKADTMRLLMSMNDIYSV
ncbi:hypothetical protein POJ06DRAFT_262031 [Lipomyces tetrasporus]|uniref:Uncharacterized protein n=1 Tax=Lipomyces tetrasporus TaxID=54092 RepID=A0AAD7QKL3_9ASCO|nr:uncharacterized protein POJ06DRAFT_262031 [Lipomyces tetrasporus]KAJ8096946.1 hypothetical protein POJ06DRAFT_262031 [Lipomyces tetrasporus]